MNMKFEGFEMSKFYYFNCLYIIFYNLYSFLVYQDIRTEGRQIFYSLWLDSSLSLCSIVLLRMELGPSDQSVIRPKAIHYISYVFFFLYYFLSLFFYLVADWNFRLNSIALIVQSSFSVGQMVLWSVLIES